MTSFVVLSAELDASLADRVKSVHGNVVELVVRGLGRVGGAQLRNSLSGGDRGGGGRVGGGLGGGELVEGWGEGIPSGKKTLKKSKRGGWQGGEVKLSQKATSSI